jgi:serine/threonine protein phosphatase PrpC
MKLRAAGVTDVGNQRDVNEDRFYSDPERGIFTVIDGVGGQAAGGRAADTALDVIRTQLASPPTGMARCRIAFAKRSPWPTTKSIGKPRHDRNGAAWPAS